MEKFIAYFNNLKPHEKVDFAIRCDTTVEYMRKLVSTRKPFGEKLCIAVERESQGQVRCEDIRADVDWAYIRGTSKQAA